MVGAVLSIFPVRSPYPLILPQSAQSDAGGLKNGLKNSAPSAFGIRRCFADRGDKSLDFQTMSVDALMILQSACGNIDLS